MTGLSLCFRNFIFSFFLVHRDSSRKKRRIASDSVADASATLALAYESDEIGKFRRLVCMHAHAHTRARMFHTANCDSHVAELT